MSELPTGLLRDTLRDTMRDDAGAPPSPACVDADVLAAWADDALDAKGRAAVESHAADCARCQALLAAMAKSAPAPAAPHPAWWRRPAFAWLVPATAGAAALLVWLALPSQQRAIVPAPRDAATAAPAALPSSIPRAALTAPPDAAGPANPKAILPSREAARRAAPLPAQPAPERSQVASRADAAAALAAPRDELRAAPSSSAAGAAAQTVAPPPSPPAALPAPAEALRSAENVGALAMKAAAPPLIAAPDGTTAFRLMANGRVERTTDGGVTWRPQETGVGVTLTAGAAPSSSVCWLVGPGGIVVLSTDGQTWRRIAFLENIDLRSIRASDEKNATVIAADGRTFTTDDGGRTWTRSK